VPEGWTDDYGRILSYADQEMQRLEAEGFDYLQGIAMQFESTAVECVVRLGDPVTEILREAKAFGADLIAVSTTGRSGVGRVVLGSVAEQVFRKSKVPVMLMRPGEALTVTEALP
jgi:nucleotide-binding universal stress UspA family protein